MWKGFRQPLQADEALPLPGWLHPGPLYQAFIRHWEKEVSWAQKYNRQPSVLNALWQILGSYIRVAVCLQLCIVAIQVAYVLLVRALTQIITEQDAANRTTRIWIAMGLGFLNLLEGNLFAHGTFSLQLSTHGLVTLFAQAALWKGAKLHPTVHDQFQRGAIVSLGLSEAGRLLEVSSMMLPGLTTPFIVLVLTVLMFALVGISVLGAIMFLL